MQNDTLVRFIKDQKVPISILIEPYFSYFIDLYNKDFKTKETFSLLESTLALFDSEQEFLNEYYKIRDNIITNIKENVEFGIFNNMDMEKYKISNPILPNANKSDIYKICNVGNYYLSIDFKKANFQMMKLFSKNLVLGADCYEDFIKLFTDLKYFQESKYTRQVIFGNVNPKRQITMQKYYTSKILDFIYTKGLTPEDICVFNNDEIVIKTNSFVEKSKTNELESEIKQVLNLDVTAESYFLNSIGNKEFFVKELENKSFKFKKVPNIYFAQAYKKYKNLEIEDYDLMFFYENNLAKFLKPIF